MSDSGNISTSAPPSPHLRTPASRFPLLRIIISLARFIFFILYSALMASAALAVSPFVRKGYVFHAVARLWAHGLLRGCGVRLKVRGSERVDFSRNFIYVANHASYFDIPAVIASVPAQIRIIYKKELEKLPLFGWGLKYGKTYIGIDRGTGHEAMASLEQAAEKIRSGASVLMFAEGTRSPDGTLQQFKRGPFNLAMKAGVPIVPVSISGSFEVLPRNSWKIRSGTITLVLGSPIQPTKVNGRGSELELRDLVHAEIRKNFRQEG